MFKTFAILFASVAVTRAALLDFALSLQSLNAQLSAGTTGEAFKFNYTYSGPDDAMVQTTFTIYTTDCTTVPTVGALSVPVAPAVSDDNDEIVVNVAINLATIESDTQVWVQGPDQTTSIIQFCGRLDIYYGDDSPGNARTFVNYHETNVQAAVTLTEDGGMNLDSITYDLVEAAETIEDDQTILVDFDVDVSKCLADGTPDGGLVTVNQGVPIYICVEYKGVQANVYVENVNDFSYWSVRSSDGLGATATVLARQNGLNRNMAIDVDCTTKTGVCIIGFYVDGSKFVDAAAVEQMRLQVGGTAVVAFGTDTSRRQLIDVRELFESGGTQTSDFEYGVGTIEAHKQAPASNNAKHNILLVVFGAMGSLLAIFAVVFFEKRRRDEKVKTVEVDMSTVADTYSDEPRVVGKKSSVPCAKELLHDVNLSANQQV